MTTDNKTRLNYLRGSATNLIIKYATKFQVIVGPGVLVTPLYEGSGTCSGMRSADSDEGVMYSVHS